MNNSQSVKKKRPGRTEAQKEQRRQKRQEQKGRLNVRQSKTRRFYEKSDDWKTEDLGFKTGIKEIEFGPDFKVEDTQLDAIASADEAFRAKIEKVGLGARLGRIDMPISDDAVTRLARACPNLKALRLDAAVLITGICVPSILTACPNLTSLSITGHDRRLGRLDLINLLPLANNPTISTSAPKLKILDLRRAIIEEENFGEPLKAITMPACRKDKLEVLFQHPTVHWERTYKNGREKKERMTAQRVAMAMVEEARERIRYQEEYGGWSDGEESLTKSELSVLIHR